MKLDKDPLKNINHIKQATGNSADILVKELTFKKWPKIYLLYFKTLTDDVKINDFILRGLNQNIKERARPLFKNYLTFLKDNIPNSNINIIATFNDLFDNLFDGSIVIFIEGEKEAISFEAKADLDRGINEPSTEQILQGPKDGFTENFEKNVGLLRKRIKTPNLRLEEFTVGEQTKTTVGLLYIKDIVEDKLVDLIRERIKAINVDSILDISYIDAYIGKEQKFGFPPHFKTERPDWVAMSLLEGKATILVDNSPYTIIIPTFLVDYFHTPDCYYQKAIHNNFLRMIRFFAFLIAILAPAFYVSLISYNQEMIPQTLLMSIIGQRQTVPFPAFIESLILLFAFELMREGDVKSPQNIGSSIAILGAVILGQAGTMAGLFSPIMVIIISITSISGLVFQSLDVIYAIRIWRYIFLLFATIFGMVGMIACGLLFCIMLSSVKSFGKPYLHPFAPLDFEGLKDSLFRIPLAMAKKRPPILAGKNVIKQGGNIT